MSLQDKSVRARVFLLFAGLLVALLCVLAGALWLGHARVADTGVTAGFVFAFVLAAFLVVALVAGLWFLFDENVARPIERLSAQMRARAHADVSGPLDLPEARYLGDLGPAADAVARQLEDTAMSTARRVASETARLAADRAQLTRLLTEIPVATLLVSPGDQIVLYDGQAAEVLAQIAPPRLNARIGAYFDANGLAAARSRMERSGLEVRFDLQGVGGAQSFAARMRPMDGGGYMLIIDNSTAQIAPDAARPLVYDFDLLTRAASAEVADTALRDLCYVVFDTETTGLLPHRDAVVQIGAVRVLGGRIVDGEEVDMLVDPGRPIPEASTRVHGISDAMVAGAPDIATASRALHHFAQEAVMVAHNAPFDMAFLRRAGPEAGCDWDHPILDTVLVSAVLWGTTESHTLDAICDRLDVTIPENLRHTALGDARATAEVLVRMLTMCDARGLTTFGKLVDQTRKHGRLLEDLN